MCVGVCMGVCVVMYECIDMLLHKQGYYLEKYLAQTIFH